jgi:hypothetical protein
MADQQPGPRHAWGACGLKRGRQARYRYAARHGPEWGVWIETRVAVKHASRQRSRLVRGVRICNVLVRTFRLLGQGVRLANPVCCRPGSASLIPCPPHISVDEIEDAKSQELQKLQQSLMAAAHLIEIKHFENKALHAAAGNCLGSRCAPLRCIFRFNNLESRVLNREER